MRVHFDEPIDFALALLPGSISRQLFFDYLPLRYDAVISLASQVRIGEMINVHMGLVLYSDNAIYLPAADFNL